LRHLFLVILIQPAVCETLIVHDIAIEIHEWKTVETAGAVIIALATHATETISSAPVSISTTIQLIIAFLAEIPASVVAVS